MSCVTIKASSLIASDRICMIYAIQDTRGRVLANHTLKRIPILSLKVDEVAKKVFVKTIYRTLIYEWDEEILVEPSEALAIITTKGGKSKVHTVASWRERIVNT